jgi:16S rRNA processing protein RimM
MWFWRFLTEAETSVHALKNEFRTARLGKPVGLTGFVKVYSYSGEYEHLGRLETVRLIRDGNNGQAIDGVYRVEAFDAGRRALKFAGVNTREEVGSLTNCDVVIPRKNAAPLQANEFYIEDLKGVELRGPKGAELGRVSDIVEVGNGFLAEVDTGGKKVFVPFRKEFFDRIDLVAGTAEFPQPWILEQ